MSTIRFVFDCEHWISGAVRFRPQMSKRVQNKWADVLDDTYQISQSIVHVVTGRLKVSGRKEVVFVGDEIIAELVYGGGEVDYAGIEYERGGTHDYLTPAFVRTESFWGPALIGAYEEVMDTWR